MLLGTMGERVVLDARTSMVRATCGATVPTLTERPTGELVTRVTSDTVLLQRGRRPRASSASSTAIVMLSGRSC